MKKVLKIITGGVLALVLFAEPAMLMAQDATSAKKSNTTNAMQVCMQAQQNARTDINKTLWLAIGFFGGILGIAAAYIVEPSPPASRLLGKSPEYVATYTDCYKDEGKKLQANAAIKGCVIGALVYVATYGCCVLLNVGAAGAAAASQQ